MNDTAVRFIVGTGRSGTLALTNAFKQFQNTDAHHEFNFEPLLKIGILHHLGRVSSTTLKEYLSEHYLPAIKASPKNLWVDCSNALPWLITPLAELLPEARFIFVTRNGKRVVSSFVHKFQDDMYAPEAVAELLAYLEGKGPEPDQRKRFWRPVPTPQDPSYPNFKSASRFEHLCYYWKTTTLTTLEALAKLPSESAQIYQFESILKDPLIRQSFLAHFPLDEDVESQFVRALHRPVNVAKPVSYPLTPEEELLFTEQCSEPMQRLGYSLESDYAVTYHPND